MPRSKPRRDQKRKPWRRRRPREVPENSVDLRCPTGKPAYPSEEAADAVLHEVQARPERRIGGGKPQRSYPCDFCPCWHLTRSLRYKGQTFEPYGGRDAS